MPRDDQSRAAVLNNELSLAHILDQFECFQDKDEHNALKLDLIEHLWQLKGNM
jgi:hypothetical protein